MINKVKKILDEKIVPALKGHGGGIEVVDVDNDIVYVKLEGGCQGCASSSATLKDGVERIIKEEFPEIKSVVDLTDHALGNNPYYSP